MTTKIETGFRAFIGNEEILERLDKGLQVSRWLITARRDRLRRLVRKTKKYKHLRSDLESKIEIAQ